ncbi:MAG: hypothetical protein WAX28_02750 [Corynebacterium variabile]|uniref:hypothetical protein n=1 Tax=Corynebacterium variabile TaxID=1727 RepID=UPI003BB791F4
MTTTTAQLDAVITAVNKVPEENFTAYRGGYRQEISTALVDAVFSIQAKYDSDTPGRGVRNRVQVFRSVNPDAVNNLSALVDIGVDQVADIMGSGRTGSRPKAEAVLEAASRYVAVGVTSADDFRGLDPATAKRTYTGVHGLGYVTFEYFAMLLGIPGVKTDVMIKRFIAEALSTAGLENVDARTAHHLVEQAHAATGLGKDLTYFEHAIWLSESKPSDD